VALSADDQRIAFIRGGFSANENSLVVANSDGSGERLIATHKNPENFYYGIAWTPDGKSITCVVGNRVRKLIEVALDGSADKQLKAPNWVAPDGDAGRAKQLTTGTGRQDGYPAVNWTPDGRIIYDSTASGSRHIWIMNADGGDQRQLTDGAFEDQGAHVSHDGRYIVFISNRTGTFHIYRMDIDGNNLQQLTGTEGGAAPFFSPDQGWVIFSTGGARFGNYSSWKVPANGGEPIPLTNDSWASAIS